MENINNSDQIIDNNIQSISNKPNKNIFKILFFITLIILIGVVITSFLLINQLKQAVNKPIDVASNNETVETEITSNITSTPTEPQETDETSNWKTYNNTEYRFKIKYPQNFETGIPGGTGPEKCSVDFPFYPSNNLTGYAQSPISIAVYDISICDQSYEKILSWYGINYSNGQYSGTTIEKNTISGLEAITIKGEIGWMVEDFKGRTSAIYNRTFIKNGKYVFLILGIEDYESIYKTMLMSLEFNKN